MKRTVIKYQEIGREIKIVAIENAAGEDDIEAEFGKAIRQKYFSAVDEHCYKQWGTAGIAVWTPRGCHTRYILVGLILSRSEFQEIIASMKRAGAYLSQLRKKQQEAEIKTITI